MELYVERQGDTLLVRLNGEIDHHTAASARREIDEAFDRERPAELTLDFSGVSFMDSSGIGLVMGRYRAATSAGARLRVTGTSGTVGKMMRLAGLEKIVPVEQKENRR